jgi:hypothetical protein
MSGDAFNIDEGESSRGRPARSIKNDRGLRIAKLHREYVVAGTTINETVSGGIDPIVTATNDVIASKAGKPVVSVAAIEIVITIITVQDITPIATKEYIVANAIVQQVAARPAIQKVVAGSAVKIVIAITTQEYIITTATP